MMWLPSWHSQPHPETTKVAHPEPSRYKLRCGLRDPPEVTKTLLLLQGNSKGVEAFSQEPGTETSQVLHHTARSNHRGSADSGKTLSSFVCLGPTSSLHPAPPG